MSAEHTRPDSRDRPRRPDLTAIAAGLILVALCAGLLPVWALSLRTPFRLIDDYGASFALWDKSVLHHLASNLSFRADAVRFRPTHDLGQLVAFGLFGADYRGHHALRLLLKVLAFAALLAVGLRHVEAGAEAALGRTARLVMAVLAFSLFFYCPNNPEARLAPQELPTVACFMGCLFFVTRREPGAASARDHVLGLACFSLALWSKEPNVIPGAVLVALALVERAGRRRRPSSRAVLLGYVVVWLHAAVKVAVLSIEGGYGRAPFAWSGVRAMVREIPRQVLLGATAPWLPLLFAFGLASFAWLGIGPSASRALRLRSALLLCLLLASLVAYVLLWSPVLRYAYPTTALVVLLTVIGFGLLLARSPGPAALRRRGVATAALALAFALATYRDLTAQFSTQYVAGRTETAMLQRVERLMADQPGQPLFVVMESEYDYRVGIYFNRYVPYFNGRRTRIGVGRTAATVPMGGCWVTRRSQAEGFETVIEVAPPPQPRVVAVSAALSRAMSLRGKDEEPILDAGAPPLLPESWFVLRRNGPAARPPA